MTPSKTKKLILCTVLFADMAVAAAFLFYDRLVGFMLRITPVCPLKSLTGLDCALCGGTRCIGALFAGNLYVSLRYNALFVVFGFLFAVVLILTNVLIAVNPGLCIKMLRALFSPRVMIASAITAFVFTVGRNLFFRL